MKINVLKGTFLLSSLLTYTTIVADENLDSPVLNLENTISQNNAQTPANRDLDSRVSNLENQMNQTHTKTVYGNYGAMAASARPQSKGAGIFLTADMLLWKVYEGGSFAVGTQTTSLRSRGIKGGINLVEISDDIRTGAEFANLSSTQEITAGVHNPTYNWDFGYRVGMGYHIPHDEWDIFANFTHFITHGKTSTPQSVPFVFIQSQLSSVVYTDPFTSASTTSDIRQDLHYYDITLELGKAYFISKYFSLDPHFGVRTSWIRQKMHSEIILPASLTLAVNNQSTVTTTESLGKNNFWGIGPTIGIDANWYMTRRVSLYGAIAGAILYGEYHLKFQQNSVAAFVNGRETDTVNLTVEANPNRFSPMAQAGLGFEFATLFNQNRMNFGLRIGYELQYWWRQNFLNNDDFISPEDLGMHGLTVQARFDF